MTITLYVKTHNKTGLKYFGKTTNTRPDKYRGSGVYWIRHLKQHGNDVTTEIVAQFDDITELDECEKFALNFSHMNNIVESDEWANLMDENGLDGAAIGHVGHKFTDEQLAKMSEATKLRWENDRESIIEAQKKSWTEERRKKNAKIVSELWTDERKQAHSNKLSGRKASSETKQKLRKPKPEGHGKKISETTKGKPKTEEHKQKMRKPKIRVCRVVDRKEMSVNHFTRWLQSITTAQ